MAIRHIDVASSGAPGLTYKATNQAGQGGAGLDVGTICRIVWDDAANVAVTPPSGLPANRRDTGELAQALEIAVRRVLQLETD
jgi:hypothetical protein